PDLPAPEARRVLGSFLFSGDDVDKPAAVLSGGEKTRLALASLVVSSANVLLLDEPTNNLDPASRAEILGALRSFAGAIVLVTHDEGAVEALNPERVVLLPDGVEDLWNPDYAELVSLASRVVIQPPLWAPSGHDLVFEWRKTVMGRSIVLCHAGQRNGRTRGREVGKGRADQWGAA